MGGFKSSVWVVVGLLLYSAPSHALDNMTDNIRSLQTMSDGFAELAAQVKSGVVAIATERTVVEDGGSNPFFGFQMPPQERQRDGAGSGVIVRFAGDHYILTNNHVIDGADNIRVDLPDSRFFDAEIVGADSLSDLALLKIAGKDLPAVELGDSDALREGEWVLAIGNPFGIAHSISTGIISGLGRGRSREEYGSYIQTDAAINPGNSGGALINVRGELIGINAAIVPSGGGPFGRVGNVGIGFAIPINQAKFVMSELVEHGRVRRGLLGVQIRDLNPLLAEAMGLETKDGVLISEVMEGRAADKGGVEEEDIVLDGLASLQKLADRADADKVQALLSGEADGNDTYLEIHAGAGGTESQDWAEMLQRMYFRWSDTQENCKVNLLQESRGEEAGIKSCTLKVSMEYSYGWLKNESGIHRQIGRAHV